MDHETDNGSTRHTGGGADTMPACPLCSTTGSTPTTTAALSAAMTVSFATCPRCQAMVTSAADTSSDSGVDIDDPGDIDDRDDHDARIEQAHRRLAEATTAAAPSLAWELAQYLAPPAEAAAVIDLNAGRGALLAALGRLGYLARGNEPSAFLCQMARASHLLGPDLLANATADASLDGLEADPGPIAAFVLDHLIDRHPDPIGLLRRCTALAPGGRLFLELPIAAPDLLIPEQRFHATPATVEFLADELQVRLLSVSVAKHGGLRVVAAIPDPSVVDLDVVDLGGEADPGIDREAVERACRAISPIFDQLNPAPDTAAQPAEAKGGR